MSTLGDGTEALSATSPGIDPATVAQPQAGRSGPVTAGLDEAIVTAEIPAVPTNVRAARRGEPIGYAPLAAEVVPAPVALRLIVWVLFFIFLVALIALAVEHYHPDWFSFLRNGSTSALRLARSLRR